MPACAAQVDPNPEGRAVILAELVKAGHGAHGADGAEPPLEFVRLPFFGIDRLAVCHIALFVVIIRLFKWELRLTLNIR